MEAVSTGDRSTMASRSSTCRRSGPSGLALLVVCGSLAFLRDSRADFEIVHALTSGGGAATPYSGLFEYDGRLYGTTHYTAANGSGGGTGGSTIYAVRPDGSDFTVLRSLTQATDGNQLFQGLEIRDGWIYGAAKIGGSHGGGTLFRMQTTGSNFTVLHHFGSGTDAAYPYAAPVTLPSTGVLYGMTYLGGTANTGALYSYDPATGSYGLRHSFLAPGTKPFGGLTAVGDWLYGMTSDHRSTTDHGSIFRYRPSDDTFQTVHQFAGGSAGGYPYDSLVWDGDNHLFGTTLGFYPFGGETTPLADQGVVFSLTVDAGAFTVLHDFTQVQGDGAKPNSAMLLAPDGWLYGISHGTEIWGGAGYEYGTLYRLHPDGSDFEVLHTFDSMADGNVPMRSLLWRDDAVWGTTAFGGMGDGFGNGTVWKFTPVPEPATALQPVVAVLTILAARFVARKTAARRGWAAAVGGAWRAKSLIRG